MPRLLVVLLLFAWPCAALAQGEEDGDAVENGESADESDATYSKYVAKGFGFSIALPDTGVVLDPDSEDWQREDDVAFEWVGARGERPIVLIQGRVDELGTEIDNNAFMGFCSALLANWSKDADAYTVVTKSEYLDVQNSEEEPSITTASEEEFAEALLKIGATPWNLVEIVDSSDTGGTMVYYSVFSTFSGESIYTITFYYLEPVNSVVRDFGLPVLEGFRLL